MHQIPLKWEPAPPITVWGVTNLTITPQGPRLWRKGVALHLSDPAPEWMSWTPAHAPNARTILQARLPPLLNDSMIYALHPLDIRENLKSLAWGLGSLHYPERWWAKKVNNFSSHPQPHTHHFCHTVPHLGETGYAGGCSHGGNPGIGGCHSCNTRCSRYGSNSGATGHRTMSLPKLSYAHTHTLAVWVGGTGGVHNPFVQCTYPHRAYSFSCAASLSYSPATAGVRRQKTPVGTAGVHRQGTHVMLTGHVTSDAFVTNSLVHCPVHIFCLNI